MPKHLLLLLCLVLAAPVRAEELSAAGLDARRKALNDLINEQWEYNLRVSPEFASFLGDKRYNDKSSDVSAAAAKRDYEQTKKFLRRFQAIDTRGFAEQERLNKELMVKNLHDSIES